MNDPFDFSPNSCASNGNRYWDPWEVIGLCGGYTEELDREAVRVLRLIGDSSTPNGSRHIARAADLPENTIQLWQLLFIQAEWCDYGMGPYSCFPTKDKFTELIEAWERYIEGRWGSDSEGGLT